MPMGAGLPTNEWEKEGTPLKRCYSTVIGSFNIKMVADRHKIMLFTVYHKSTGNELLKMLTLMTLNDLKPHK